MSGKPTICLCMIVRDEAHIIRRCLESVAAYVDHYAICDTGSVDDTCVVTRAFMKDAGIPGKVYHHAWQDFGYNRTLALEAAANTHCEFTLVIDADEVLVVEDPTVLEGLDKDAYRVEMRFPGISYPRVNLMRSARNFRYVGVIHEYATCDPVAPEYLLDPAKIHMWTDGDGARSRSGKKIEHDLAVMKQSVIDEPLNPRYWFYLAQGYETAGQIDQAIVAYGKRTQMGDYPEEVWYSHFRMAQLCAIGDHWRAAILHYLDAYACNPSRAEPLFYLALGYHNRNQDHMAMMFLEQVVLIEKPVSALFVEPAVYDTLRWVYYAVCLWNTGQKDDARQMAVKVLVSGKTPEQYVPFLKGIVADNQAIEPVPAGV